MDPLALQVEVLGPISVEPVTSIPQRDTYNILLPGPTGSGKSAFIESIAGHGTLNISNNQLESVAQYIQAYKIQGLDMRWLIGSRPQTLYLIDTPGFLDTRMSEMKVVLMLKEWLEETNVLVDHTLYFDRITDVRLNKSRQKCVNIFKSIVAGVSNCELTIVTTMWDQIWNKEQQGKAEIRMKDLGEYWGEYTKPTLPVIVGLGSQSPPGAKLVRFHNTRESAMEILSTCIVPVEWTSNASTALERMLDNGQIMNDTSFGPLLEDALMDRIERLRLQHQNTVEELEDEELMEELPEYRASLIEKKEDIERDLKRCKDELEEYRRMGLMTWMELHLPFDSVFDFRKLPGWETDLMDWEESGNWSGSGLS